MSANLQLVPRNENAAARLREAAIEKHLSRFRAPLQPRVRALARVHPWVADLVVSFPALAVALAVPRRGIDHTAGLQLAVDGAPLATIAARLRVPLWLRALPPYAFDKALPLLPDDAEFRRRIANHFPKNWRDGPRWLDSIALAYDAADSDIALWFARELPPQPKRPRYRRHYNPFREYRLLALFAWLSRRPNAKLAWNADMNWANALTAARSWSDALSISLHLGCDAIDTWFAPGCVDGYDFVALVTGEEIEAESAAMNHCVRTYGFDIAENRFRVFSVRKNGERIATLSVHPVNGTPVLNEIAGPKNANVPAEVWVAAHRWMASQDVCALHPARFAYRRAELDQEKWRATWRDYWLAKRRIPAWLPLKGSESVIYAL